jgi:hypothetical protein
MEATATEEWCFKGEGNANIVFAYAGSDPALVRGRFHCREPLDTIQTAQPPRNH